MCLSMEGELDFSSKLLGLIFETQEKTLGRSKSSICQQKVQLKVSSECLGGQWDRAFTGTTPAGWTNTWGLSLYALP